MNESPQKTKSVRIKVDLHGETEKVARSLGIGINATVNIIIAQGLESIANDGIKLPNIEGEKPVIDAEELIKKATAAAAKGPKELRDALRAMTPQEQNAIKYDISELKKKANDVESAKTVRDLSSYIAEGDAKCLEGFAVLKAWYKSLDKKILSQLESHKFGWGRDAHTSDQSFELFGHRIKERKHKNSTAKKVDSEAKFKQEEKEFEDSIVDPDPFAGSGIKR